MTETVRVVQFRVLDDDDRIIHTLVVADGLNLLPWYHVTAERRIVFAPDMVHNPPWRVEARRSGETEWTVIDRSASPDQGDRSSR